MLRTIKSYVLRVGRVSPRQQFALENFLAKYQLCLNDQPWNLQAIFENSNETVVEIGFGMGASLISLAKAHPELNFIGIEVHRAGVGSLVADLEDEGLKNVRVVMDDAVLVFQRQFLAASLSKVQIFFPDPWHKKRHNKRRLIQLDFVKSIVKSLKTGAILHCATDWEDYALHMFEVLSSEKLLQNSQAEGGFSPRPNSRPLTKFELRGQKLGHGVWDLIFYKH